MSLPSSRETPALVDLHVDTLSRLLERGGRFVDDRPDLRVSPSRLRAGNVRLLLTACFTAEHDPEPASSVERLLRLASEIDEDPCSSLGRVRGPTELESLEEGTTGMLITIENARSLEGDIARLESWRGAGVCIVGLTWNGTNDLGCGVLSRETYGLSPLGQEVVRQAARLGFALDLSHLGRRGVLEVLEEEIPVVATHSNARAVHDHPRNLDDEQLRAIGARGGIVGLNFYPPFLAPEGEGDLSSVARHAAHIAEVIGVEAVAVGTDLDGVDALPERFRGHQDVGELLRELAAVGFQEEQRAAILGQNFLRWWRGWSPC